MLNLKKICSDLFNKASAPLPIFLLLVLIVLIFFWIPGAFEFIGVPLGYSLFNDARVITAGAESFYQGFDPLIENPAMPTKNVMNYPRIWYVLFSFGLNQEHTVIFGGILTSIYLLGIFIILVKCSNLMGRWAIFFCVVSPASMLAMERGNIDLLIFFLFALALVLQGRALLASAAILIFSTLLKLFPIFALPVLLLQKDKRYEIPIFIAALIICLLYFYLTRHDLVLISQGTPRAGDLSYGKNVIFNAFGRNPRVWSWVCVGIGVLLAYLLSRRIFKFESDDLNQFEGLTFFIAACLVYTGTFLIGNNWDYRLIFLIFSIPFLCSIINNSRNQWLPSIMKLFIFAILISMWYLMIKKYFGINPFFVRLFLIIDELTNWLIFIFTSTFLMRFYLNMWKEVKLSNVGKTLFR